MADVTGRMLNLLAFLQTGRAFSSAELARGLGVGERTVRRDVDRLRGYGYPVRTRPGPGGHYRLAAGRAMPPLMLEDDEAVAILLALAAAPTAGPEAPGSIGEATTRAFGKLDQLLPARLATTVTSLRSGLEAEGLHAPDAGITDISRLAAAIRDRRVVAFAYHRGQEVTPRRVEPHRQVHHLLRWYLVAWDLDKGDWRVFRTDRIRDLHERTQSFTPRSLPADSALEQVLAGIRRDSSRVVLTVETTADDVAGSLPYESMELASLEGRRTRVVLHSDDWPRLLTHLAHLDAPFVIQEPQEWATEIRRFATALLDSTA